MKKSKFTSDAENNLAQFSKKKLKTKVHGKFKAEHYIAGNGSEICKLKFYNLTIPEVKSFMIDFKLYGADFIDIQKLWFESDQFETMIIALYWLEKKPLDFLIKNKASILKWISRIDNWAHSDLYCCILARLFDADQKSLLSTYKKWNKHKISWYRRCSMVGTFYYSRMRTNQPSFNLAVTLVSPHFKAQEYYVQKAVGWTIREMYNVYPNPTLNFMKKNLHQLTPVAWVAASEKLPLPTKNQLLKQRKLNRTGA